MCFFHVGAAKIDMTRKPSRGIMMTGNPQRTYEYCYGWGHETGCDGVMIDVTFDDFVIPLCRRHLDLLGDMIIHTRQLREADVGS